MTVDAPDFFVSRALRNRLLMRYRTSWRVEYNLRTAQERSAECAIAPSQIAVIYPAGLAQTVMSQSIPNQVAVLQPLVASDRDQLTQSPVNEATIQENRAILVLRQYYQSPNNL